MSSYDMDGSPAPEAQKEAEPKKVSFRFCRECSNTLYPFEDAINAKLMFACKICHYNEPATTACIYRNALKEEIAETAGNVQDVAQDPTVGDSEPSDSAYNPEMDVDDDYNEDDQSEGADVPAFCTLCGQEITCPFCGETSQYGFALEAEDPDIEDDPLKEEERIALEKRERALSGAREQLPHSEDECSNCGTRDAVFFQSQQRNKETGMALFFVCTECSHVWSTIKDDK